MSIESHVPPSGLEKTAILDAFAHDKGQDRVILAMFETRPWNLGERQLIQLQDKLNAYLSFILDGEMLENFPQLQNKPIIIELRTIHEPSQEAFDFIVRIREQLHYQEIDFVVVILEELGNCLPQSERETDFLGSQGCCQEREGSKKQATGCCCC